MNTTQQAMTAAYVRAIVAKESAKDRLREESGEVGSWVLIAGILAVAAILAGDQIASWVQSQVATLTGNSTAGSRSSNT